MKKSTHGYKKVELFQALMKNSSGKYIAVLSDNSIDRDGEMMHEKALNKIKNDTGTVSILLNHENKIENLIGEWVNRKIMKIDGHTALVAEPKFYESNPKAQMIKGMLDEGAKCGISIGAIVKDSETVDFQGKSVTAFTELELLEASFVAIPSNRHGHAMAVAKSFNMEDKMSEKINKELETKNSELVETISKMTDAAKEFEESSKAFESEISKLKEDNSNLTNEISKMKEENETSKKVSEESLIKAQSELKEQSEKVAELEKQLNDVELNKGDFRPGKESDLMKEYSEGKLPIMR